ncbi:unnamed protein product [Brassicogethes aeneus]|uniref:Uncharacterized protein n=1 Tax=Brassicogethes aeneus TaxID=1431903 RepID=A0A9P0B6Q2_BRAAE|nr:unnamed protein product [Brassicogethes aeneus]
MKQVIVKKEPEELVDDSERDISINYDKPSTSSDQEMPSTSGMAIKQKIKKELHDSDNSMDYDESGVKEEPETSTDEDNFDGAKQTKLILEAKYEEFLDKGSKINDGDEECDDSDHGDESENFLYNIKEEGDNSESSVEDNKNYLYIKDEGKDENEAMFETKIEVKYHGVEYNDISAVKSGADSEVVNKNILAKIVLPKDMVSRFTPSKKKQNNNMDHKKQREKQRLAMRRLREARRQDPEKYEEEKRKERLRYHARKESGKIKSVKEMSEEEKSTKRKEWREKNKKWYNKQKELAKGETISEEIKNEVLCLESENYGPSK